MGFTGIYEDMDRKATALLAEKERQQKEMLKTKGDNDDAIDTEKDNEAATDSANVDVNINVRTQVRKGHNKASSSDGRDEDQSESENEYEINDNRQHSILLIEKDIPRTFPDLKFFHSVSCTKIC